MWESKQSVDEWKQDIESLSTQIDEEEEKWQQAGFHPGMIQVNDYLIQMKLNLLITFIESEFGVSHEEMEARFKTEVLDQLKRDRAMLLEHKLESQRTDLKVMQKPQLLGPSGRPIL